MVDVPRKMHFLGLCLHTWSLEQTSLYTKLVRGAKMLRSKTMISNNIRINMDIAIGESEYETMI